MLSLPKGIRRSVRAHNSDRSVFYDWLEASLLFVDEELSGTDVVDFLTEQQIYDSQNLCSEFVSNAWAQVRRRLGWLGAASPIAFRDSFMIRTQEWAEVPGQTMCMLLSLGNRYDGWSAEFGPDYTEQGALFEALTAAAMARAFPNWTFHPTGWSRDNTVQLSDVVNDLASALGETVGDVSTYASEKAHEAGLDLVWYLPFTDDRGGLPVYLAQCASGNDWPTKLSTPNLEQWRKLIHFASVPYKAFSIPFSLDDRELKLRSTQIGGLVLDRYRLLLSGLSGTDWVPADLRGRIVAWCQPRVQWLMEC